MGVYGDGGGSGRKCVWCHRPGRLLTYKYYRNVYRDRKHRSTVQVLSVEGLSRHPPSINITNHRFLINPHTTEILFICVLVNPGKTKRKDRPTKDEVFRPLPPLPPSLDEGTRGSDTHTRKHTYTHTHTTPLSRRRGETWSTTQVDVDPGRVTRYRRHDVTSPKKRRGTVDHTYPHLFI